MPESAYHLFLDGTSATEAQLEEVEEITVVQGTGVAWVARVKLNIHTDDSGVWSGEDHALAVPFMRMRIEVKPGAGASFVPLIEGPVVGSETRMSSEPGKSTLTVEVHDDSAGMNRRERVEVYEDQTADQLARRLFSDGGMASSEVETAPPPSGGMAPVYVQRETDIQFLRRLARDLGFYAYVLPGEAAGSSVGAFKTLPVAPDGLPELVLLGSERNVMEMGVRFSATRPATATAHALSLSDLQTASATSTLGAVSFLGAEPPVPEGDAGLVLLPPGRDGAVDVERWTAGATERSAYAFEATGKVTFDGYAAVLSPYRVVTVRGIDGRLSGDWLVHAVTHTMTRSSYGQEFTLQRNARSAGSGGGGGLPSIF